MHSRAVLLCLLFVAVLGLALPAVAQDGANTGNDSVENVTVGQSISGFMQSTQAGAESDVDQGIYEGQYETANDSERGALVTNRTDRLERRLATVEERIERLRSQRDKLNPTAYRARMSAAAAQLRALEASANATERDATTTGVNATRLETLRTRASELSGGEVAAIARSLAGAAPEVPGRRGPPDDPGRDEPGPPNGTPGDEGNGNGPPDDRGNGTGNGNGVGTGNSDGAGTGSGNGAGTGNSDGAGTGTGGGQGTDGNQGTGTDGQGTGNAALIGVLAVF